LRKGLHILGKGLVLLCPPRIDIHAPSPFKLSVIHMFTTSIHMRLRRV
jgi:hypothetical protein